MLNNIGNKSKSKTYFYTYLGCTPHLKNFATELDGQLATKNTKIHY